MSYGPIKKTNDVMKIKEQEYGVGSSIQTTKITSCICVVGRVPHTQAVLGIHLVIVGSGGGQFDDVAADLVGQILDTEHVPRGDAHIVGQLEFWRPGHPSGYAHLMQILNNPGPERKHDTGDHAIHVTVSSTPPGFTFRTV